MSDSPNAATQGDDGECPEPGWPMLVVGAFFNGIGLGACLFGAAHWHPALIGLLAVGTACLAVAFMGYLEEGAAKAGKC